MSNTNNTMQTQTSNTLHNAIMEAGGKDRPPMLALGNYVQWKTIIKRYIDTKPNHELIYYCLKNPPYKFTWADKEVPVTKGSSVTTTERYMENYKNVSQDICDQLNAEAKSVQIILIGIDNNIYSTVDACPNVCEMWKAIERLKQGESINVQDLETNLYWEFRKFTSRDGESLESYYSRFYKMMNELIRNQYDVTNHQVNVQGTGYESKRIGNVAGARETVEQADWRDDTDDEPEDQELEAHYMYMAQIQEVTLDAADNSGPIFDSEPKQKVQNNDNYNVFAIESEHPEQSESVNDTYPIEQDEHNVMIDSLDMSYDREQIDHDDDNDLANERHLLASLIEKLKCEIDDSKNRNKFLETSNKVLVDKLKGEIEDFKTKNKSLESSNNRFKEENNKLSETNELMYNDLKKFQAEHYKRNDLKYASKVEIDFQTMNMLNRNCKTSFAKPEFLKKAQRANPRLYDIGCYNDNLALMLAPESDEVILLKKESRSKLTHLIRPFDYEKLNNLYDLFVPQREKSSAQRYFSKRSKMSHTPVNNENSKESFNKQTTLLEKRMDESIPYDQKCKSSKELFKIKRSVAMIFDGVECCKQTIAKRTYFSHIDTFIQNTIEANFYPEIRRINADLEKFHLCLKEKMVADLRYFNSLELEVDSLKSQLETQKTQFLNEIDRLSREYYYADHMNAILGVYNELDEDKGIAISELKKLIEKLKGKSVDTKFEKSSVIRQSNAFKSQRPSILGKPTIFSDSLKKKDFSKSKPVTKNNVSNDFSKPITTQILPPNKKLILKNTNVLASKMSNSPTSVSRPQLKSNRIKDRILLHNSQGKKQEVEDHRRNVKFSKNKTSVTACNESLKAKTSNVNFVCATCRKCVLNVKHDMCVLQNLNGVNSWTKMPIVVPISTREPKRIINQSVAKPLRKTVASRSTVSNTTLYSNSFAARSFGCSKHMTGNLKLLINIVEKFLGTVKSGNDQIAPILGYGDLVQGAVTIKRVYYVEWMNYNLFSISQFYDADLEVAFRKSTCYIRDLKGNDLLTGSRGTDLYSITLQDTSSPNPICLMAKATSSQAWLWHHRLSHLNFDTINLLSKMILLVQRGLHAQVRIARTDKGMEFLNKTLHAYFASEGIHHQTSVARTPKQNGVVERRNRTLVEAARTMLSAAKVPLFFWAEAIATACFTQNRYSTQSRAYKVFNKRTRVIVETIHVNFYELPQMASDHVSSDPVPQCQRTALEHDSLSLGPQ
nr:hypothetical protein [Tanacetum cinerariifolium]